MKDVIDMHTHTLASGHAYNTIREMTQMAKQKGVELLGITEHGPKMSGSCQEIYFGNLNIIDRNAYDVPVLFGAELNIFDENGSVDLPEYLLADLDYCIASMHHFLCPKMSKALTTQAMIRAIENPYVKMIGHPDDGRFELDYDQVVAAAKENHVLIEVNNASLRPNAFRENAHENDLIILDLCKKYQAEIILSSDAHTDLQILDHRYAAAILEEAKFPTDLVVNDSPAHFMKYI